MTMEMNVTPSHPPAASLAPVEGRELRKHPRVALHAAVDISSGANFYAGRTRDISLGGLFMETTANVAVGMPLTIRLDLLGKPSEIQAEVVWVLSDAAGALAGAGLRFLELTPELRAKEERLRAEVERQRGS